VMLMLKNMFIVKLYTTYQDKLFVYFLLDACLGGELFTIHRKTGSFDEETSRFFAACVVEGLAHIHSHNIAYRDLKPENLVLDNHGYLKIADFGLSKIIDGRTYTMCGTPDYLAPEIITGKGHGIAVDWWALGVLIFELVSSFPPFFDKTMSRTFRRIIGRNIRFTKLFSTECRNIVTDLLNVRPFLRLGAIKGGAELIRKHQWFSRFRWEQLREKVMVAPLKTCVRGFDDISNFTAPGKELDISYKFVPSDFNMDWAIEF